MTPPKTAEQINGPQVGSATVQNANPLSELARLRTECSNLKRDLIISHQQLSEALKDKERLDWRGEHCHC